MNNGKIISKNSKQKKIPKAKSLTNFYKNKYSDKILEKESLSKSLFYKKINYSLTNNTFCYYREITYENNSKFNPFSKISPQIICDPPLNFIPCEISFNDNFSIFNISIKDRKIYYKINEIENTVVSSIIKLVVEIHRKFKRIKGNENDKKEIIDYFLEKFAEDEKLNYPKLNREEIKKCALNNYYDFSIILINGKRIEFIMTSYEDFKDWINGFALIIKNKNLIISTLEANTKSN